VWPNLSQRGLAVAIAVVGTGLAAWLTMERYITFLLLIGSVFVPLFAMLAATYFVRGRRAIEVSQLYERDRYWFAGGVRPVALLPWLAGFLVFHWIAPTGPAWWIDLVTGIVGSPLSERWGWVSASIPAFAVSFALALLLRERFVVAPGPEGSGLSSAPTK
jgi:purine-cytosine permease-like protein